MTATGKQQCRLVLASGSPRRKELLQQAGYEFEIIIPDPAVEEGLCSACPPEQFVAKCAAAKAEAVARQVFDGIVIAADTIAVCNGQILGKPVDVEHAARMLRMLSGKRHYVLTAVHLWQQPSFRQQAIVDSTELQMESLSDLQIEQYLESDAWIGKAGAFGYQDGLDWVSIVSGRESTVVGFPIELLPELLEQVTGQ